MTITPDIPASIIDMNADGQITRADFHTFVEDKLLDDDRKPYRDHKATSGAMKETFVRAFNGAPLVVDILERHLQSEGKGTADGRLTLEEFDALSDGEMKSDMDVVFSEIQRAMTYRGNQAAPKDGNDQTAMDKAFAAYNANLSQHLNAKYFPGQDMPTLAGWGSYLDDTGEAHGYHIEDELVVSPAVGEAYTLELSTHYIDQRLMTGEAIPAQMWNAMVGAPYPYGLPETGHQGLLIND